VRGKHIKLGERERKVRLGQDSLPNIAISIVETSGNYIRCFTRSHGVRPPPEFVVKNSSLISTTE
jgi:hypothetical protein